MPAPNRYIFKAHIEDGQPVLLMMQTYSKRSFVEFEDYAALHAEREWRPMETAPRGHCCDTILLAFKFFYCGEETVEVKISYWSDSEKGWDGLATSIRNGLAVPIAWMPMPKPPKHGAPKTTPTT